MLQLNLKARLNNKSFWISLISTIIIFSQQCGFNLSNYIPNNYAEIINTLFILLTILGITIDTSTPGISDQVISQTAIKDITKSDEIKSKNNSTVINSQNNEISFDNTESITNTSALANVQINSGSSTINTSANSKIKIDNPDNVQAINTTVNATSAVQPQ